MLKLPPVRDEKHHTLTKLSQTPTAIPIEATINPANTPCGTTISLRAELNGMNSFVADADADDPLLLPVPPPVKFAPFGFKKLPVSIHLPHVKLC